MNVDGGGAVNRKTWNARSCFALLKSSDTNGLMFTNNVGSFDDNRWRWCDWDVIIKLQRMSVIACRDARIFQQSEKEMVTVDSGVSAVAADIMIVLFCHCCVINSVGTFIQQKVHLLATISRLLTIVISQFIYL